MHLSSRATSVARVALAVVVAVVALTVGSPTGVAAPARINGSGSGYVALAMQQWVADAQTSGLAVNYLPTSSPEGLVDVCERPHRLRRHRSRVLGTRVRRRR